MYVCVMIGFRVFLAFSSIVLSVAEFCSLGSYGDRVLLYHSRVLVVQLITDRQSVEAKANHFSYDVDAALTPQFVVKMSVPG